MTPWQLSVVIEAENERRQYEHEGRAWLAWHAAYLDRTRQPVDLMGLYGRPQETPDIGLSLKAHLMAHYKITEDKGKTDE